MPDFSQSDRTQQIIFVSGTDTHVGKTIISQLLVLYFRHRGYQSYAIKPFCSGATDDLEALASVNDDHGPTDFKSLCHYYYEKPLSPYACCLEDDLPFPSLSDACRFINNNSKKTDILIVEGAGGFHTPIAPGFLLSHLINQCASHLIIVAPDQLGCLNHSLLTWFEAQNHLPHQNISLILSQKNPNQPPPTKNFHILQQCISPKSVIFCPFLIKFHTAHHKGEKNLKKPLAVFSDFDTLFLASHNGGAPRKSQK